MHTNYPNLVRFGANREVTVPEPIPENSLINTHDRSRVVRAQYGFQQCKSVFSGPSSSHWITEHTQPKVIHSTLGSEHSKYSRLMTDPAVHLGDGGFSRVVAINSGTVLKITSCPATMAFFKSIIDTNRRVSGLPIVYQKLGVIAHDADNIEFEGYYIQRLFPPSSEAQKQQRAEIHHYFMERLGNSDDALFSQEHSESVIKLCISENRFGLAPALTELLNVLRRVSAVLDLTQQENIMFDSHGYICLADPLAPII